MIVKVIRSPYTGYWYKYKEGDIINVEKINRNSSKFKADKFYYYRSEEVFIQKKDCIDLTKLREQKLKRILF